MAIYCGWAIPAVVSMISSKMVAMRFLFIKRKQFPSILGDSDHGNNVSMAIPGSDSYADLNSYCVVFENGLLSYNVKKTFIKTSKGRVGNCFPGYANVLYKDTF